ncbi:hypothetical protein AVEN_38156-1 [Araneus ventricosus]|uniref:Uncharacterized protein n=1 Tax=Araneus ventricosus TaxID=182803 RepID=A0A4Y2F419_ARAVE|nr:hypothetical protein AVEN_38156-1 [Araneus ventricosus]
MGMVNDSIEARFVPSVNQSIETGIEEIRVQVAELRKDGFRNFDIGSEMVTCQVLLQRSEGMKITWCKVLGCGRRAWPPSPFLVSHICSV